MFSIHCRVSSHLVFSFLSTFFIFTHAFLALRFFKPSLEKESLKFSDEFLIIFNYFDTERKFGKQNFDWRLSHFPLEHFQRLFSEERIFTRLLDWKIFHVRSKLDNRAPLAGRICCVCWMEDEKSLLSNITFFCKKKYSHIAPNTCFQSEWLCKTKYWRFLPSLAWMNHPRQIKLSFMLSLTD